MILNGHQGIVNVCQDKPKQQQELAVVARVDSDIVLYTGRGDC